MISKYNYKSLNWIDLESPRKDEIEHVIDLYSIPESIKNKLFARGKEDTIDLEYDYIYATVANKITFVVSDNFVLTIHNEKIQGLNKFSKEMESDILIEEKSKIVDNRLLFAYLLKNLYADSDRLLLQSEIRIQNLKQQSQKNYNKIKKLTIAVILLSIVSIIFICL